MGSTTWILFGLVLLLALAFGSTTYRPRRSDVSTTSVWPDEEPVVVPTEDPDDSSY